MAGSPEYKLYTSNGEYIASFKYPSDASHVLTFRGPGTTLRYRHRNIVWAEGKDGIGSESADVVAEVVSRRVDDYWRPIFQRAQRS